MGTIRATRNPIAVMMSREIITKIADGDSTPVNEKRRHGDEHEHSIGDRIDQRAPPGRPLARGAQSTRRENRSDPRAQPSKSRVGVTGRSKGRGQEDA